MSRRPYVRHGGENRSLRALSRGAGQTSSPVLLTGTRRARARELIEGVIA